MSMVKGKVALIGSGELSGTMVETHKRLLAGVAYKGKALFLDTPAGFQENADLISERAINFFKQQVQYEMELASFKSAETAGLGEGKDLFHLFSEAGYVLMGPGSPTYAVRQLGESPIPALLSALVTRGGCLVVASAAALTAGSYTLPVYEIYKVGEDLHWIKGLDILGHLGLDLVVIPHWNNAEGGNHDTRYCYMGEKRFRALEDKLPEGTTIIGIDEHTACILDFSTESAGVEGLGQVTMRRGGKESYFSSGEEISFALLRGGVDDRSAKTGDIEIQTEVPLPLDKTSDEKTPFWEDMHRVEEVFERSLENHDLAAVTRQLLEADRLLWQAQLDLENPEFVSQGRELFREMIVLAGTGIDQVANVIPEKFKELINGMVELRELYRREKKWFEADQIRSILQHAGVALEDTQEGPRWYL